MTAHMENGVLRIDGTHNEQVKVIRAAANALGYSLRRLSEDAPAPTQTGPAADYGNRPGGWTGD